MEICNFKFKLGQKVFYVSNNFLLSGNITKRQLIDKREVCDDTYISSNDVVRTYEVANRCARVHEDSLYFTKNQAIDAALAEIEKHRKGLEDQREVNSFRGA